MFLGKSQILIENRYFNQKLKIFQTLDYTVRNRKIRALFCRLRFEPKNRLHSFFETKSDSQHKAFFEYLNLDPHLRPHFSLGSIPILFYFSN